MNWRSTTVAGLVDALGPTLPAAAFVAAIAADDGGCAVRLSDGCPLEGRFEMGSPVRPWTHHLWGAGGVARPPQRTWPGTCRPA
ncbi:hypothetical protein [Actinoallomurus oryzae]|uniref:hypothetical protein n=1 Tax=Actinoallomurus oryzae TaxID=502180 RepID=UPI0031EC6C4E